MTKKYAEPTEKQLESNGRVYHVVVYKTGLTGVKPGKLDLQSATQSFLISTPFGMRSAPDSSIRQKLFSNRSLT